MKLHFEEEIFSLEQACIALTSNLEGTARNCVLTKRANERDSSLKILDILLNGFGSGIQDSRRWLCKKFQKGTWVELQSSRTDEGSDELKTMLVNHLTLSAECVPTADDLRMKLRENLLIKPRARNCYIFMAILVI